MMNPDTTIRGVVNPGKPSIKATFRLTSRVLSPQGMSPKLEDVIPVVLEWIQAKHTHRLSASAYQGESFTDTDTAASQVEGVRHQRSWAVRMRQPDVPFKNRRAVPGRIWTTDIGLSEKSGALWFGCTVTCSNQPYGDDRVTLTRPRICIDVANKFGLVDDLPLSAEPMLIRNESDLSDLWKLLTHRLRTKPVVVVSGLEMDQPGSEDEYVLDPRQLATRLYCLAHVVTLPAELARDWARMVGDEWAVFRGGVRVYRPGLDFDEQEPYAHPLTIAGRIRNWYSDDAQGPDEYAKALAEKCIHDSLGLASSGTVPFISELRSLALNVMAKQAGVADQDQVEALKLQLAALEKDREEWQQLAEQALADEEAAKSLSDWFKAENHKLRVVNDGLRLSFSSSVNSSNALAERPREYNAIPAWVEGSFAGRLFLHPRARRALKDARYRDIDLVLDSLEILADSYRDMRLGLEGAKARFDSATAEKGLGFEQSISESRKGEQRDTYFVQYPPNSGRNLFLKWHLTKGSSRNQEDCLRVYFEFDDETSEVVVGWLPSHLDTRST